MSANIVETRVYYRIFAVLLVLLLITVAAVTIEHRPTAAVVAVTIAVIKAVLIVLFFMHVGYSTPLVRVFAAAGFVWLAILLALTASDYLTRRPEVEPGPIGSRTATPSGFPAAEARPATTYPIDGTGRPPIRTAPFSIPATS